MHSVCHYLGCLSSILMLPAALIFTTPTPPELARTALDPVPDALPAPEKDREVEGQLGARRRGFTAADVHAALGGASSRTRCIVRVEVAGVGWNPYAVGQQGELGPGQLHPRGLLPRYLADTGGSPFDPYTVIPWIDRMLERGYAAHWAGPRLGIC